MSAASEVADILETELEIKRQLAEYVALLIVQHIAARIWE